MQLCKIDSADAKIKGWTIGKKCFFYLRTGKVTKIFTLVTYSTKTEKSINMDLKIIPRF